jgi:RNA polymerase sigma-70 factor (family 1)
MRDCEDKGLVKLIRLGNKIAFEEIYLRYHKQLYLLAIKYLKSKNLAEDAVQVIFIKFWQKRGQLDPDKSVKALLFISMKNHVLNMIRNRKNKIISDMEFSEEQHETSENVFNEVISADYEQILHRGLAELPERKRKVFELKTFNGFSNSEVAELLTISINTVKVHYYHGSQFIRSYLKKHADINS